MSDVEQHGAEPHHPNYLVVWAVLLVLLFVSIGLGFIPNPVVATVLVFGIAFVKAALVACYFMHLLYEKTMLRLIAASGFSAVLVLLVTLIPDIVYVYGG